MSARACASIARSIRRHERDLSKQRNPALLLGVRRRQDLERSDQLLPVLTDLVDGFENARRFGAQGLVPQQSFQRLTSAFVLLVQEQDLAVVRECSSVLAQVLPLRLRQTELEIDEIFFRHVELDPTSKHVGVALPRLRLEVETVQSLEGDPIDGIVFQHGLIGLDRVRRLPQLSLVQARDFIKNLLTFFRVRRQLSLLAVDVQQVTPALGFAVQPLECLQSDAVLRLALVHRAVLGQRLVHTLYFLDQHAAQPQS